MSEIEHGGNSEAAAGPSGFWARHWHKLAAATIWMLLIAFFWLYINQPVDAAEGAALASGRRGAGQAIFDLILFMQETVYGPVIFILLYTLRPLAFFSAALLTIAGGFLFGPLGGVLATVIGANLSASLAYVVGRVLGSGVLDQENSAGVMRRYASRMRNNSFETILIMRFVFLPYDLVNYLAGFLHINYRPFILATILGSIPGTISFALLGATLSPNGIRNLFVSGELPGLDGRVLLASAAMFVVSLLLSRYFKRRERNASLAAASVN